MRKHLVSKWDNVQDGMYVCICRKQKIRQGKYVPGQARKRRYEDDSDGERELEEEWPRKRRVPGKYLHHVLLYELQYPWLVDRVLWWRWTRWIILDKYNKTLKKFVTIILFIWTQKGINYHFMPFWIQTDFLYPGLVRSLFVFHIQDKYYKGNGQHHHFRW